MPKFVGLDISGHQIGEVVPVGTDGSLPYGTLLCDGSSVSRTSYPLLFAAVGTRWGAPDASSFNLPDLRGRFLRGRDAGAGRDPDRASRAASASGGVSGDNVGSVQGNQFASHGHGLSDPGHAHGVYDPGHQHYVPSGAYENSIPPGDTFQPGYQGFAGGQYTDVRGTGIGIYGSGTGISVQGSGGSETRPENANVNYAIAYV